VLEWVSPSRLLEGKRFVQSPPDITVTTDASTVGWGAVCLTHRLSGRWSVQESRDHINLLELKAVVLALQGFEHLVVGRSVLIQSDNRTVVAYINRQGGTHSIPLCMMVLSLWEWCILKGMHLLAAHISGTENVQADFLSRGSSLSNEWMLLKEVFLKICRRAPVRLEIDLFASAMYALRPKFCSRGRDPQAWKMDALSFPWTIQGLFAFPPFSIIP